jgi:hypothetical protein
MNLQKYINFRRLWWQLLLGLVVIAIVAAGRTFGQEPTEKREAWEKALPHIQQAERESLAAIDEAVGDVSRQFDQAAPKLRPWVEELLGIWGKLDFVVGSTQNAVNWTAGLLDDVFGTQLGKVAGQDRFEKMARESFAEKVLDPADIKRAIKTAVSGYGVRLDAVAAKLFVEIGADVPDANVNFTFPVMATTLPERITRHIDAAMADAISAAAADFALTAGKELLGQFAGNLLTTTILGGGGAAAGHELVQTGDPVMDVAGVAVGFVAGMVASYGIDKIQEFVGHDPVGQLAVTLSKRLVTGRDAILLGDANTGRNYSLFALLRHIQPDARSRAACGEAVIAIEGRKDLGLKWVLKAAHFRRARDVRSAVWKAIHGEYAPLPAGLFEDLVPVQPPDQLTKIARAWTVDKGGKD